MASSSSIQHFEVCVNHLDRSSFKDLFFEPPSNVNEEGIKKEKENKVDQISTFASFRPCMYEMSHEQGGRRPVDLTQNILGSNNFSFLFF